MSNTAIIGMQDGIAMPRVMEMTWQFALTAPNVPDIAACCHSTKPHMAQKPQPDSTATPSLARRMALSDAKGDVDDRVRDLAASERELEKADFDLRYKTHEAKLVNKAAVAKRTEVGEVISKLPSRILICQHFLT